MHAYLITGNNEEGIKNKAEEVAKKIKAKILEFPLMKIEDTRNLNSFVSLKVSGPTAILLNSIEAATTEALNAFLKNLEEPQENLFYILTTKNVRAVLPTIVSRCQIIKTINNSQLTIHNKDAENFLEMTTPKKLIYLAKMKDREEAEKFVSDLIDTSHSFLHERGANYKKIANNLKVETRALGGLRANGNVSLQLTNMAINLG